MGWGMGRSSGHCLPCAWWSGVWRVIEPDDSSRRRRHLTWHAPSNQNHHHHSIGHDFYVFQNQDTNAISVVYKRKLGGYGLIEPSK